MNHLEQMGEAYPLISECISYECMDRKEGQLFVVVRWSNQGPEDLAGRIAAEAVFTYDGDKTNLLLKLEDNVTLEEDVVHDMCLVYGFRGAVEVEVVHQRDIRDLGVIKVR